MQLNETVNAALIGSAVVLGEATSKLPMSWYIEYKLAFSIIVGIIAALVLHVGIMLHQNVPAAQIKKSFMVNLLASVANFTFTAVVAYGQDWPYIFATGLAIVIGMQGVEFYVNGVQKMKEFGPRLYSLIGEIFTRRN